MLITTKWQAYEPEALNNLTSEARSPWALEPLIKHLIHKPWDSWTAELLNYLIHQYKRSPRDKQTNRAADMQTPYSGPPLGSGYVALCHAGGSLTPSSISP